MSRPTFAVLALVVGCGAPAATAPKSSTPTSVDAPTPNAARPPAAPRDPFALPASVRADAPREAPPDTAMDAWAELSTVRGGPAPAPSCQAYAKRAPAGPACKRGDRDAYLAALRTALDDKDAAKRDAELARAEACETVPGATRALRAELAPAECGDAIVEPWLTKTATPGAMGHALVGYAIAGKLARAGHKPPKLTGKKDKATVLKFVGGPFAAWMTAEATAIERLSKVGARLRGFGLGVAAVEAGLADMRLVEVAREGVIPEDWKDEEIKTVYYAALDQALEPRKVRGRSAALAGLTALAAEGVTVDARLDRAHALLGKMFAGRRIDALTQLLLPPVTASPAAGTPTEALAGTLPTFFADALLADALTQSPEAARRALTRGAPAALVSAFGKGDAPVTKDGTTAIAYARARLALGMRSWRGVDFDQAARVAHGAASPDARLVLATALALGRGPDGAAAMMASRARCTSDGWGDAAAKCSPTPELELMHVEALDALGGAGAPHDAYATFNAAYLLWISTPPCCGGAETTAHFKDVRDRFARASSKLNGAPQKRAEDLHRQAAELVEALAKPH